MIYDAHCHLDLMDNMLEFINEIQNSDMNLFAVGTTPKAYSREIQFCKNARNIHVGLGMHPQLVSSGYDDMQLFKSLIEKSHYIGEVGLDFSKGYIQTKELQINIFSEILRTYKRQKSNKYIFHWFTGSMPQLEKAIELGCYFSINPGMLKTKSGMEVIKAIPIDHVLLETDAPFALKVQHIDEIEKELKRTMSRISDVIGFDISDIINKNSKEVFCY